MPLQTGLTNPLDAAILDARTGLGGLDKVAEVPYDFVRKRLSVIGREPGGRVRLVTKGAFGPRAHGERARRVS